VVVAFSKPNQVPWPLRNCWNNVLILMRSLNFIVSHIYREGNIVADNLANEVSLWILCIFGMFYLAVLDSLFVGINQDSLTLDLSLFSRSFGLVPSL
jgi:hypothetical protein